MFAARFVDDVRELPEEVISVVIGVLVGSLVLVTTTVTGVLDSPGVVPDAVTTDVITCVVGGTEDSDMVEVETGAVVV